MQDIETIRRALARCNRAQVARDTDIHSNTLHSFVNGKTTPHRRTLKVLSDYLFGDVE
jgi:hypothetical protein